MEDWENMVLFAIHLISNSNNYRNSNILDQRIAILNLDHANELLMKAFLIKEGYTIEEIDKNKIKEKGIKKGETTDNFLNKKKTIGYIDCLNLISKILNFDDSKKKRIIKFHEIRNEIQHRSIDLPINKEEEIVNFYPSFRDLYNLMFQEPIKDFPVFIF